MFSQGISHLHLDYFKRKCFGVFQPVFNLQRDKRALSLFYEIFPIADGNLRCTADYNPVFRTVFVHLEAEPMLRADNNPFDKERITLIKNCVAAPPAVDGCVPVYPFVCFVSENPDDLFDLLPA